MNQQYMRKNQNHKHNSIRKNSYTWKNLRRIVRAISGTAAAISFFTIFGIVGALENGMSLVDGCAYLIIYGTALAITFTVWYKVGGKTIIEK